MNKIDRYEDFAIAERSENLEIGGGEEKEKKLSWTKKTKNKKQCKVMKRLSMEPNIHIYDYNTSI